MSGDETSTLIALAHEQGFELGGVMVRPSTREVVFGDDTQVVEPRIMQVLVALARRRGLVTSRDDLIAQCWGGRVVGEDAINRSIAGVRKIAAACRAFDVETVVRVGYRLNEARVSSGESEGPLPVVEAPSMMEVGGVNPDALGGGRPTLAVLPFEHPPDDREQTYIATGIAEDVIAALTRFKWLFVLSRHSSLNYNKSTADIAQIRADLGVRYIVSGQMMCRNGNLRLVVSLTDCTMSDAVWSRRFNAPMSDIFEIQDQITATIVGALEPALLRREETAAFRPQPRSLQHWDLFIRGRWHFWQLTKGHVAKAHNILKQALELRPDDVGTLSLLAYTYFTRLWSGWTQSPEADLAEARRLAMRAVRLDRDDAFAHYTYGIALSITGDLDRAMAEQRQALTLNPNFTAATAEIGRYLAFSGRCDEAIAHLDKAIRSSPGDAHYFLWFRDKAIAAFTCARYDEAVGFANQAVALRPDIFFNHYLLAASWAAAGDQDRAKRSFTEGRQLLAKYPLKTLKLGHPFARPEDLDRFVDALKSCGWDD